MNRNVERLTEKEFDLVVIGGGIFGICAAWDAALRGLSVALLEKGDFSGATSANCFKIVHGGIRYLQHGDLYRVRESSRERSALLRIAPHLVKPLPIVIPTYGNGLKGKEILKAGLFLYDMITLDRNRGIEDPQQQIPSGYSLSREEAIRLFPGLEKEGLTGAAVFYDGQMYSPPRLALSFLKSAVKAGTVGINYVEATGFLYDGKRVYGVKVKDTLTGNCFEVRGKIILNAAGPWVEGLLRGDLGLEIYPSLSFSRDASFVVKKRLLGEHALALQGRTKDPDAIISRGPRHLFICPWRDYTLIGVWHVVHTGSPEKFTVTQDEIQRFIDEVNEVYSTGKLTLDDVSLWNAGLVLFGKNSAGSSDLSYGKRSVIIDHAKQDKVDGIISLIGVRYTTARGVAERVIDLVFNKLGKKVPASKTETTPIYGGQIEQFSRFIRHETEHRPPNVSAEAMKSLLHKHGSEYREVLKYINGSPGLAESIGDSTVMKAEIIHAVREESAQKLGDVIFRRTELGVGGYPGNFALETCTELMGRELGWDHCRKQKELQEVQAVFPRWEIKNLGRFSKIG